MITEMLTGIRIPNGFDVATFRPNVDREWTASNLAGGIACAWIDEWIAAKAKGDSGEAAAVAEALAESRNWPLLTETNGNRAIAEAIWEYSDAVAGDGPIIRGSVGTVEEAYEGELCPER